MTDSTYGADPEWRPEKLRFKPLRLLLAWLIAALSVSHGDRRMRGRNTSTPNTSPRDEQPPTAPSEIGAGVEGKERRACAEAKHWT